MFLRLFIMYMFVFLNSPTRRPVKYGLHRVEDSLRPHIPSAMRCEGCILQQFIKSLIRPTSPKRRRSLEARVRTHVQQCVHLETQTNVQSGQGLDDLPSAVNEHSHRCGWAKHIPSSSHEYAERRYKHDRHEVCSVQVHPHTAPATSTQHREALPFRHRADRLGDLRVGQALNVSNPVPCNAGVRVPPQCTSRTAVPATLWPTPSIGYSSAASAHAGCSCR